MRRGIWMVVVGMAIGGVAVAAGEAVVTRYHEPGGAPVAYQPVTPIKDLMENVVDTSADDVWNSVQMTVSDAGTELKEPHTDEEWAVVRRGAVTLVEAANLLMIPGRHMARAHVKSETPGIELEPEEMERLVNADRAAWNARAHALQDKALEVLAAVDARNAEKLWEVGGELDGACENCHRQYWYPDEKLPGEVPGLPSVRTN
jgi:hypothetical protein